MGMPVTLEVVNGSEADIEAVFDYFHHIDETFSIYKDESEISRLNRNEVKVGDVSPEMREILKLSEETRIETDGYFDIKRPNGTLDPSGLVKGWAIEKAANLLHERGCYDFCLDVGGDIQTSGKNSEGSEWRIGIRNPFNREEIVKTIIPKGHGVATSGTYIRGEHILDPKSGKPVETNIVSLTVIGRNVYEADRFATAAFAMGAKGIEFLSAQPELEAYEINRQGLATMTSGFENFLP